MIICHILHLFRLDSNIGAVYVAMRSCIKTVISFILTYLVITMGFAFGLHFILKWSPERCESDDNKNDTIVIRLAKNKTICASVIKNLTLNDGPAPHGVRFVQTCRIFVHVNTKQIRFLPLRMGNNYKGIDDHRNHFVTFHETVKTLYWSLFDPGHAEVVGCSVGISRYTGLVLWALYNTIVAIVLLNLLIALMNATMSIIQENKINSWKYNRTQLWMEYCNHQVSIEWSSKSEGIKICKMQVIIPPPMNLIGCFLDLFGCCNCWKQPVSPERVDTDQYRQLLKSLMAKYINDMEDQDESEALKDDIDRLRADVRKLCDGQKETKELLLKMAKRLDVEVGGQGHQMGKLIKLLESVTKKK